MNEIMLSVPLLRCVDGALHFSAINSVFVCLISTLMGIKLCGIEEVAANVISSVNGEDR